MTVSIQASEKLTAELACANYDHDPGAATAILASPDGGTTPIAVDMSQASSVLVGVRPTIVGGTGMVLVRLMASLLATGANGVVIKTTGAIAGDSLNDQAWLEVTAEEIAQAAAADGVLYRYVTIEITMGTNTDEANVTVIQRPRFKRSGLTATLIT